MFISSLWDVIEPTHYSRRVGDEVPGVVTVLGECVLSSRSGRFGVQYGAQFSATKNVNLYFLPWNSRKDLKFQTTTSFSIQFTHVKLSTAQPCLFSPEWAQLSASAAQFLATKKCARFLRMNNALSPILLFKSLIRLVFDISTPFGFH